VAKDWEKLGGEKGQRVETGRFGRAMRLGRLASRVAGSALKAGVSRATGGEGDMLALAATKNARQIVDALGEMKGAAMKVGQLLSADPDLVAPEFADQLTALQQAAPPMKFATVTQVVEDALDQPISEVFRYFDPEPIGAASIGQVHRATLFDGRCVAVKVQYPGIKASLDSDLRNLGAVLKLGRVFMTKERADAFVTEAREAILGEADYHQEGQNLERFHALLADQEGIRIPAPVLEFTRETVLVMEFIEGQKLDDALLAIDDRAERSRILQRFVGLFVHMFHDLFVLHGDPHPGNFLLTPDHEVVLLDWGCVREFRPEITDGVYQMLIAFWNDDMAELSRLLQHFEFGREGGRMPTEDVLREYHRMILEPVAKNASFDYSQWTVHGRARAFVLRNPDMLRLVPPAELLLYFRVLTGMKGLVTRVGADVNLRALAEDGCRRRGLL